MREMVTDAKNAIPPMVAYLDSFDGITRAEKIESFLLSIGVTPEEIASIREILMEQ